MAIRRLIAVGAAVAMVAAIAASGASAGNTYLCYSKSQVDPGVWADSPSNTGGDVSSSQLIALGYWLPFAEKSTPTSTQIPGGWYLNCNPTGATTQSASTTIIGGAGETVTDASLAGQPGYYPMAP